MIFRVSVTNNSKQMDWTPLAQSVECLLRVACLIPGPDIPKSLSCSLPGTQANGVVLGVVDPVSGCDGVWYHIKCLGHDTSVR